MLENIGNEIQQVQNRSVRITATDSVRRVAAAVDYHNSLGATGTVADDGTVLIIRSGEERGTNLHASVEGYIG
jgi:arginine repressor